MFKRLTIAAALAAVPAAAVAHHGWSSYDESKPITLTGSFQTVTWGNPHGTATTRWQGKQWGIVLAPTSRMQARGLTEAEIAPGKRVSITGYARRDGAPEMRIERVMVGGKTVELR
ncbi:DUF6152 family protein [Sphingomonas japonica]|uniref:DUF5666 domain-containing protein n=1 Tax=Sphingomonas japonica TaxID=511662 RepID=A0ABX0TZV6_9SPHN|nr:DUF6152 family protein [Sphingomonas japonica]NIJ22894.1 hypothetical protein [Sphingomonas japonica]